MKPIRILGEALDDMRANSVNVPRAEWSIRLHGDVAIALMAEIQNRERKAFEAGFYEGGGINDYEEAEAFHDYKREQGK
jgi:hypothetical protein